MLLFKNEYPANTSNRCSESSDILAAAGFGASDGNKLRFVVTLAGAGELGVGSVTGTETVVVPEAVCAPAGTTKTAKKANNTSDVITPSFFIFSISPKLEFCTAAHSALL
jgi:hypothetical protein